MPELFGTRWSRAELLRRLGRLEQAAGVRLVTLGDGLARGQAPGELAEQGALGQDGGGGLGVRGDRRDGEGEQDGGDRGVDLLVVAHLAVAEVEEGLPADVAARGGESAEQVIAVGGGRR